MGGKGDRIEKFRIVQTERDRGVDIIGATAEWTWNGQCGCGEKAALCTSRKGVQYYYCRFFVVVDDAQCTLRSRPLDQMPTIAAHGGAKWPQLRPCGRL